MPLPMRDHDDSAIALPPHSVEAEQAVIGAILLRNAALAEIDADISSGDFYVEAHRLIYSACRALIRDGKPADVVTVHDYLVATGGSERAGGIQYLGSILEATPSSANAKHYAGVVREKAVRRRALEHARTLSDGAMARDGRTAQEVVDDLRRDVDQFARQVLIGPRRKPIDWQALAGLDPPPRDWAVAHWIGMGHVTLLAGRGGIGKSLLAQQLASYICLGRDLIDDTPIPRNVLIWAAEDDIDELWRRQNAICQALEEPLQAFSGRLVIESYVDRDCTLVEAVNGRLQRTPMVDELRSQIHDCAADVVILDNIARLFGGEENSRHDVTSFVTALMHASGERKPAIILLGHVAKLAGSEYSGSSAWENAVRARLWFHDQLPDQQHNQDDAEAATSDMRYLSRRKSNYSAKDLRTMRYQDGVFRVDDYKSEMDGGLVDSLRRRKADRVIVDGLAKLLGMNFAPTDSYNSPHYLPRLLIEHGLHENVPKGELVQAMRKSITDGVMLRAETGTYGTSGHKKYRLQLAGG